MTRLGGLGAFFVVDRICRLAGTGGDFIGSVAWPVAGLRGLAVWGLSLVGVGSLFFLRGGVFTPEGPRLPSLRA